MSLAVKVEHRPSEDPSWLTSMWDGNDYIGGTATSGATRAKAIANCVAAYEKVRTAAPIEFVPYQPVDPPPLRSVS